MTGGVHKVVDDVHKGSSTIKESFNEDIKE
jgi:hypothetical protein